MTGPLLSTLQVFGVRGRTGVLSVFFLTAVAGHQANTTQFLDGGEKGGKEWRLVDPFLSISLIRIPSKCSGPHFAAATVQPHHSSRYCDSGVLNHTEEREDKWFLQAQELGLLKLTFPPEVL